MAKAHRWFGTTGDSAMLMAWLKSQGATFVGGDELVVDDVTDGREFVVHFPSIGPAVMWPKKINLPSVGDNSSRAKQEILALIRQQEQSGRPYIDADRSAVAGIQLPELREGRYWVAGEVWFPTAKLAESFPGLNTVCQRLERFLRKHPTVYDNRRGESKTGFEYQLCMSGVVGRYVALPEAKELLGAGAFMIDRLTSPKQYQEFRRRLQLSGHERL